MEYKVVCKDEFYIIGFKKRITLQFKGENHQIDSMYERLTEDKREKLIKINDTEPKGLISVSADISERTKEGSFLDQYLAVASTHDEADDEFDVLFVPSSDWAVFTSSGSYPDALQNTWAKIYSEWLGSSDYELRGGPEILRSGSQDTKDKDFKSEIWIPVKKKKRIINS